MQFVFGNLKTGLVEKYVGVVVWSDLTNGPDQDASSECTHGHKVVDCGTIRFVPILLEVTCDSLNVFYRNNSQFVQPAIRLVRVNRLHTFGLRSGYVMVIVRHSTLFAVDRWST